MNYLKVKYEGVEKFMFKKLPNSTRKFIRSEKARIRRQFLDYKVQEEAIANMYNKILNQPLGHSPTGEAIVKKLEISESTKLKEKLPKRQEKGATKKGTSSSQARVRIRKNKVKMDKKKKVKK